MKQVKRNGQWERIPKKIDGEEKRTNLKQRKEKEQFGNSWK